MRKSKNSSFFFVFSKNSHQNSHQNTKTPTEKPKTPTEIGEKGKTPTKTPTNSHPTNFSFVGCFLCRTFADEFEFKYFQNR